MVCLDTDFLIAIIRGQQEAISKARELDAQKVRKTTTPVNLFELYLGAYLSKHTEENLSLIQDLLYSLEILELDDESCEMAGRIAANLKDAGKPIGARDSMIAGMVLRSDESLITRNSEHFSRIEGLKSYTW